MNAYMNLAVIGGCLLCQAFFSGFEMVILSANKIRLRRQAAKKSKGARLALEILGNPRWYLATTSTGTNMFVIVASVVAAVWFEHHVRFYSELATVMTISPFLLIFGEIIPRSLFQEKATEIAPKLAYPFWIASKIISPVTFLVYLISSLFYRRFGIDTAEGNPFVTKEELELMLNAPQGDGGDLQGKEKRLIRRVFHLAKSDVSDVMVPLFDTIAISEKTTIAGAIEKIRETGFSRLPVYQDRIDHLIGIVHAFDLLDVTETDRRAANFIREVPFVPETKNANDLLVMLQKTRNTIAIVVDEYGGAVGIVTIEDILEEVVGEIRDEYDRESTQLIKLNDNRFLANARMEIEEANEAMQLNLPKEDYETLGGFLLKQTGRIPKTGESFRFGNTRFIIRGSNKRTIKEIIIEVADEMEDTP